MAEAKGLLTQEADPGRTTILDARGGFKELFRLAMLFTVRHCYPSGARLAFNFYKNWEQFLLCQPGGGHQSQL